MWYPGNVAVFGVRILLNMCVNVSFNTSSYHKARDHTYRCARYVCVTDMHISIQLTKNGKSEIKKNKNNKYENEYIYLYV